MTYRLPAKSFWLIRHGETTANRDERIAGRLDVSLTETGRAQAIDLRSLHWPAPYALFSSPMQRARNTCELGFLNAPYETHIGLRERNWGVFEGQPLSMLPPRDSCPPDGESWSDMIDRVADAISDCCEKAGQAMPIIICHSGVVRATRLLSGQAGSGLRPPNARPIHFIWSGDHHQEILYVE